MEKYKVRLEVDVEIWADDEVEAQYSVTHSTMSWDDWDVVDKEKITVTKIDTES